MRALWLCLAVAGVALAQDDGQRAAGEPAREQSAKGPQETASGPLSCEEKCEQIAEYCEDPCAKLKKNPEAKSTCRSNCKKFLGVCKGSCREKGKIDAKYLEEKLTPPGGKPKDDAP